MNSVKRVIIYFDSVEVAHRVFNRYKGFYKMIRCKNYIKLNYTDSQDLLRQGWNNITRA